MTASDPDVSVPSLDAIRENRARLGDAVRTTPAWEWQHPDLPRTAVGRVFLKLELLQHTGSFKVRGALTAMARLDDAQRRRGVTAVSAGNHAMAVAHAANVVGTSALVVMPRSADPARVEACRVLGAEVVLVDDVHAAFEEVRRIEREQGRHFVHPFEGFDIALGTATLGLELAEQVPDLDAVVVPIGGGGLCAGVACAIKQSQPRCQIIGVEPEGADTMHRSFAAGKPESIPAVRTIADSLGAPHAAPYSFALCRRFVDDLLRVSDDELCAAMLLLFRAAKLAVEPAGAATTAAWLGPLHERLAGRRVALIVCGANVAPAKFCELLSRGQTATRAHPSART